MWTLLGRDINGSWRSRRAMAMIGPKDVRCVRESHCSFVD